MNAERPKTTKGMALKRFKEYASLVDLKDVKAAFLWAYTVGTTDEGLRLYEGMMDKKLRSS